MASAADSGLEKRCGPGGPASRHADNDTITHVRSSAHRRLCHRVRCITAGDLRHPGCPRGYRLRGWSSPASCASAQPIRSCSHRTSCRANAKSWADGCSTPGRARSSCDPGCWRRSCRADRMRRRPGRPCWVAPPASIRRRPRAGLRRHPKVASPLRYRAGCHPRVRVAPRSASRGPCPPSSRPPRRDLLADRGRRCRPPGPGGPR